LKDRQLAEAIDARSKLKAVYLISLSTILRRFFPRPPSYYQVILATFLFFVSTAYMILMRDINTSLITFLVPPPSDDPYDPAKVLLYTVVLCFPCMLLKSLHSLRYNCYVGFVSGKGGRCDRKGDDIAFIHT